MTILIPKDAKRCFKSEGMDGVFWDFIPGQVKDLTGVSEQIEAMMEGWA